MNFTVPALKDLQICFDNNDSIELIRFEDFKNFLVSKKCAEEPSIKSSNVFRWLKGKDHFVKEIFGKPAFRTESVIHFIFAHADSYNICKKATNQIKKQITQNVPSVNTNIESIKEIYEKVASSKILDKELLSSLSIDENNITSLHKGYKNEFSDEKWRKICFFELHFMREVEFDISTDTYESMLMKKSNFFQELQRTYNVAKTLQVQSRHEILNRIKRQEVAECHESINLSANYTHNPSVVETQLLDLISDRSLVKTLLCLDCTNSCKHNKGLHVYIDIRNDDRGSIDDITTIVSTFIEKQHNENCAEIVFFIDTVSKYTNIDGENLRFQMRDDFLIGKLNKNILHEVNCDQSEIVHKDEKGKCTTCYGTTILQPLTSRTFDLLTEWYLETPVMFQILMEMFINKMSLKKSDDTDAFLRRKYTKLYFQYDVLLNVMNKHYFGVLQDLNMQELSINYHSVSNVFHLTSTKGLTPSLTTAEQKMKRQATSERTYFSTYLKKYQLTYETNAGEVSNDISIRDCVLILMMDNLVRLKKRSDPDPGECRTLQLCTLPITLKGIPKDAAEVDSWHDNECDGDLNRADCSCMKHTKLSKEDIEDCILNLSKEQKDLLDAYNMLLSFGFENIWKKIFEEKIDLITCHACKLNEVGSLDLSLASLQLDDRVDMEEISDIEDDLADELLETTEIQHIENIQLEQSIVENENIVETEELETILEDSFILHSDDDHDVLNLSDENSFSTQNAKTDSTAENRILTMLGFKQYRPPPLLSKHPPPAIGRDDDIKKLQEILDEVLMKTDHGTPSSHKILFAPDHKIASNLLKLQEVSSKYLTFLPEFPALHLRKSKITILCSAYKDAGVLHILKYMRDEDFQEWRKLISAEHIEMATKYIRRLSISLHTAFFITFMQSLPKDRVEKIKKFLLQPTDINLYWDEYMYFLEEGRKRNGTFALHLDIMKHCDEVCAIAFAERLGGKTGYNLLLAAVKSSLQFSFLNGASSYAAFTTKLLHEYYQCGPYYRNMKHTLFSTPHKESEINFALDTQREMDHKDAIRAFRSGSTVSSILPRMSLLDSFNETHTLSNQQLKQQRQDKEKNQAELLGVEVSNTDLIYITRVVQLILRQGGITVNDDEDVFNVYDANRTLLPRSILDSSTSEIGKYLIRKFIAQQGLFSCTKSDEPSLKDVTGSKELLQKLKVAKGVTLKRVSLKSRKQSKTEREEKEEVRLKSVKQQMKKIDCLSSEMNACQAIVKPDCSKPKVVKSAGIRNALIQTLSQAISEPESEDPKSLEETLEEKDLIFLGKKILPKSMTETATHATVEFAGVKFKTKSTSGNQYLKYVENGVIMKTKYQLPNVKQMAICEEKYHFTPDDFKAATRSQRVTKQGFSITHLKTSEEILAMNKFDKHSIITTAEGKSLISTYLSRNIYSLCIPVSLTVDIDSEHHISPCLCQSISCCCKNFTNPVRVKFLPNATPDIEVLQNIKQTKGEAEMSQVDWVIEYQPLLNEGESCVSIVTSGDIDAVIIHMMTLSYMWKRLPGNNGFYHHVYVVLQKAGNLHDIYNITKILQVLEEKWKDEFIGIKIALALSLGGNDFLPKFHGISHSKTVETFLSNQKFMSSLFECSAFEASENVAVTINADVYKGFIKSLYCSKNVKDDDFTYDEIRQLSVLPVNAKTINDYRNPQLWMPPASAVERLAKNVQCLIDYYLTAGHHCTEMPNFFVSGSFIKTKDGEIEYDLGPDSCLNSIHECLVSDVKDLTYRLRQQRKRKQDFTPTKRRRRRRKLCPQASSTPRKFKQHDTSS